MVSLLDEFRHTGPHGVYVCLVFEVMGENLVELGRRYDGHKLPVDLVKQIARQLLLGLDYLHGSCEVVHTGLCQSFAPQILLTDHLIFLIDIQPLNIMIEINDVESVVRNHLSRHPYGSSSSEPTTTQTVNFISGIQIKIADFGVGK